MRSAPPQQLQQQQQRQQAGNCSQSWFPTSGSSGSGVRSRTSSLREHAPVVPGLAEPAAPLPVPQVVQNALREPISVQLVSAENPAQMTAENLPDQPSPSGIIKPQLSSDSCVAQLTADSHAEQLELQVPAQPAAPTSSAPASVPPLPLPPASQRKSDGLLAPSPSHLSLCAQDGPVDIAGTCAVTSAVSATQSASCEEELQVARPGVVPDATAALLAALASFRLTGSTDLAGGVSYRVRQVAATTQEGTPLRGGLALAVQGSSYVSKVCAVSHAWARVRRGV